MKFNKLEAAKSELQAQGHNLPEKFENRELNEKEATKFNWYVVIDTAQSTGGRSSRTITHLTLQAFDAHRLVSPSVRAIVESGDAIMIHDMNKREPKAETPKATTATRGRKKKEDTNETDA